MRDHPAPTPADRPLVRLRHACPECGRSFDLLDPTDAAEWTYGHDCEPPAPTRTYARPGERFTAGTVGDIRCSLDDEPVAVHPELAACPDPLPAWRAAVDAIVADGLRARCAHRPNDTGTACDLCGLPAEPVSPAELADALGAELQTRDAIDADSPEPEPFEGCALGDPGCTLDHDAIGADADDRGSITAGEPGALFYIDPDDNATEYPGGGSVASLHAEPLDAGPESSTVAWLGVTVSTDGPERVRAVIELGRDAALTLADILYAAVRLADEADER